MARMAAVSSPPPWPPFHLGFSSPASCHAQSAFVLQLKGGIQNGLIVAPMAIEKDEATHAITIQTIGDLFQHQTQAVIAQRNGAGEPEMMIGHSIGHGGDDEHIALFLNGPGQMGRDEKIGAQSQVRTVVFDAPDGNDHRMVIFEIAFRLFPGNSFQSHVPPLLLFAYLFLSYPTPDPKSRAVGGVSSLGNFLCPTP